MEYTIKVVPKVGGGGLQMGHSAMTCVCLKISNMNLNVKSESWSLHKRWTLMVYSAQDFPAVFATTTSCILTLCYSNSNLMVYTYVYMYLNIYILISYPRVFFLVNIHLFFSFLSFVFIFHSSFLHNFYLRVLFEALVLHLHPRHVRLFDAAFSPPHSPAFNPHPTPQAPSLFSNFFSPWSWVCPWL